MPPTPQPRLGRLIRVAKKMAKKNGQDVFSMAPGGVQNSQLNPTPPGRPIGIKTHTTPRRPKIIYRSPDTTARAAPFSLRPYAFAALRPSRAYNKPKRHEHRQPGEGRTNASRTDTDDKHNRQHQKPPGQGLRRATNIQRHNFAGATIQGARAMNICFQTT